MPGQGRCSTLNPIWRTIPSLFAFLGPTLETLDFQQLKWAGHGLEDDASYQFIEGEYMKGDEYDEFLFDPTDFIIRRYWPRVFSCVRAVREPPADSGDHELLHGPDQLFLLFYPGDDPGVGRAL